MYPLPSWQCMPPWLAAMDMAEHHAWIHAGAPGFRHVQKYRQRLSCVSSSAGLQCCTCRRVFMRGRSPRFVPCTPLGCMELLERAGVQVRGPALSAAVVAACDVHTLFQTTHVKCRIHCVLAAGKPELVCAADVAVAMRVVQREGRGGMRYEMLTSWCSMQDGCCARCGNAC
jgi:hypothetical protein